MCRFNDLGVEEVAEMGDRMKVEERGRGREKEEGDAVKGGEEVEES